MYIWAFRKIFLNRYKKIMTDPCVFQKSISYYLFRKHFASFSVNEQRTSWFHSYLANVNGSERRRELHIPLTKSPFPSIFRTHNVMLSVCKKILYSKIVIFYDYFFFFSWTEIKWSFIYFLYIILGKWEPYLILW